jgi:hypothetical protein
MQFVIKVAKNSAHLKMYLHVAGAPTAGHRTSNALLRPAARLRVRLVRACVRVRVRCACARADASTCALLHRILL